MIVWDWRSLLIASDTQEGSFSWVIFSICCLPVQLGPALILERGYCYNVIVILHCDWVAVVYGVNLYWNYYSYWVSFWGNDFVFAWVDCFDQGLIYPMKNVDRLKHSVLARQREVHFRSWIQSWIRSWSFAV